MFHPKTKFELSPKLKLGVGRAASKNQILKISGVLFLLVAVGLTVQALTLVRKGQLSPTPETNPPASRTGGQVLGATASQPAAQFIDYKVQKGDTVFNISQTFKVPWTTLAALNSLQSPFALKIGQVLKIPKQ